MTITFFSNFLHHHQLPLCLEFIKHIGMDNFYFVACDKLDDERVKMGYQDMNYQYPFVLRLYESEKNYKEAEHLMIESDVVIIGSAPKVFIKKRIDNNKLTFLFRERIFKNGNWHRFIPTTAYTIYMSYTRYRNNSNLYILCASAYAADDFEICGFPRERCLKWGYFPEIINYDSLDRKNTKIKLMWCGRMLWWKHPEHAIYVAKMLKDRNIDFELLLVGNGEMENKIESLINKYNLQSYIERHDFMSPDDIRYHMTNSDIYIFSSGKQEGWGVVLNEAMNSGCAVIANTNAGSTPCLMKNGNTGYIYDGSIESLRMAVDRLITKDLLSIGNNAYNQIKHVWNPVNAVRCLLQFINNQEATDGNQPCNKA